MKRVKIDELLALNPNVDGQQLKDSLELAERLRDVGLEPARGYRLATPMTGKRLVRVIGKRAEQHTNHLVRRH